MTSRSERGERVCARNEPTGARRLWPVLVCFSAAIHAAAILALISGNEPAAIGQSGNMEAMSIQVSIASSTGVPEIAAAEEPEEASKAEKASAREKPKPQVSEETAPLPQEAAVPPEKHEEAKKASAAQAMARIEARPAASGTSAGDIEKYGREVSVALARSVPKAKGQRGKVTLAFVLDAGGRITHLDIVSPSGDAYLDEAAQDAVRKAVFPPPPQGMTEKQRTYVIPFRFR
jgi:TonB family protein